MIVDPDFCDHWKTRKLINDLGGDEAAISYVLRIWAHCQNRRQWRFSNFPSEALKALCRFPGDAKKLESSLADAGFIKREDVELVVCNWEEYNRSLIAAWVNGSKGGRKPIANPRVTDRKPRANPPILREEEIGKESSSRAAKKRDELFDAVAEVTASDPNTSGSYIGRVCKALRSADPPYTPDEVRRLPAAIAANGMSFTLTLGAIEKYIGLVRGQPKKAGVEKPTVQDYAAKTAAARAADAAERAASVPPPRKDGVS